MYEFLDWVDAIAAVSTQPEYQNLTVTLIDPANVVSAYDVDTGVSTVTSTGVFWTGRARLVSESWGSNFNDPNTENTSAEKTILIQFPSSNLGTDAVPIYRIRKGIQLRVTASAKNPALLTYPFVCTSDIQGGNAAARTIEFAVDGDAVLSTVTVPVVTP